MNIFARIAQMESSRFVGGRAQTQALLRAPDKTSRTATTGACPPSGSRGVTQYYAGNEIIRMPAGSIVQLPRLEPRFESFDPPQANLHRALMFALPISLVLWGLIGLAVWGLVSVFL